VLFERRFWAGIADGSLTTTYRRWRRPQAVVGRRYRTPGGIVEVSAVDITSAGSITDADARTAGYDTAAALIADLRGDPAVPLTRVRFDVVDEPDPRTVLAGSEYLTPEDVVAIERRLARFDAGRNGPWTAATIAAIREHPGVRAAELAAALGRETQPFKLDVRKLKELGLTLSLDVGYRLSPRGESFLRATGE